MLQDTSSSSLSEAVVRCMLWDDLPAMLAIAEQTASTWMPPNFRLQLQTHETIGFVGVRDKQVVSFALCTVHRQQSGDEKQESILRRGLNWLRRLFGTADPLPRRIRVIAVGLAPQLADAEEIERALLQRVDSDLGRPSNRLEMAVPETDFVAQSLLRDLGFVADRMLSGHYLHIDGWLMVRDEVRRTPSNHGRSRFARCAETNPRQPGIF
jgi:ribosomal protein S18 acetylase RimI-like enzyme